MSTDINTTPKNMHIISKSVGSSVLASEFVFSSDIFNDDATPTLAWKKIAQQKTGIIHHRKRFKNFGNIVSLLIVF